MARTKWLLKRLAGSAIRPAGVVCLNYHRIGDGRESVFDRGLWSATAEGLDRQLRWLKAEFDVISARDLPLVVQVRRGRHALVTFDDGYADNFTAAFPVLRANRVPAAFFVSTGFLDAPSLPWWDEIAWMVRRSRRDAITLPGHLEPIAFDDPGRERAVRRVLMTYYALPADATHPFLDAVAAATGSGRYVGEDVRQLWMTWDMVRQLRDAGMTIGGHTVTHRVLSRMSRDQQMAEIAGCARRLEEELGMPMRTFAYPTGLRDSFDSDTRACLQGVGVRAAFSYYGGYRSFERWDPYDIPRIAIEQDTDFDEFRGRVLGAWMERA